MHVLPTQPFTRTPPTNSIPSLVREYTSDRAFRHDAQELYRRTGYTVSETSGLAHRSYLMRVLGFWRLRQEHLVITYQSPTNPWPANADVDE
jgi:hypothetical protein